MKTADLLSGLDPLLARAAASADTTAEIERIVAEVRLPGATPESARVATPVAPPPPHAAMQQPAVRPRVDFEPPFVVHLRTATELGSQLDPKAVLALQQVKAAGVTIERDLRAALDVVGGGGPAPAAIAAPATLAQVASARAVAPAVPLAADPAQSVATIASATAATTELAPAAHLAAASAMADPGALLRPPTTTAEVVQAALAARGADMTNEAEASAPIVRERRRQVLRYQRIVEEERPAEGEETAPAEPRPAGAFIERIWFEHDVLENGQPGLRIHVRFRAVGLRNLPGRLVVYLQRPGAGHVLASELPYRAAEHRTFVARSFMAQTDDTVFEDLPLFFPYEALPGPGSNRDVQLFATIWAASRDGLDDSVPLARSEIVECAYTTG